MTIFEQYTEVTSYECSTTRKLIKDVILRLKVATRIASYFNSMKPKSVYLTKLIALDKRLREEYPEEYV